MKKSIFVFLVSLLFFACNSKEEIEKWPDTGSYYDPGKPITFDEILPLWGRIDQTFVIKGNFPEDISKIKVYFEDKKAILISSDGNSVVGVVPKQGPGNNKVSLVVGNDSIVPDNIVFRYYQTQSVKTVVGKFDEKDYKEGSLDEARVHAVTGMATVNGQKGDNLIIVQGGWGDRVSFVSLDDNKMVSLTTGMGFMGGVAASNSKDMVALISRAGNRILYTASRGDGWTHKSTDIIIPESDVSGNIIGGVTFGKDDRYVYLLSEGNFVQADLEQKEYKVIIRKDHPIYSGLNLGSWYSYLTYSKYHDCFFSSYSDGNCIFKIYQNGEGEWAIERFAGFNSGETAFGHRLNDAVLRGPMGMAVNTEGEIYVACTEGHCIIKIVGDLVSLVAGHPDQAGKVNGYPLDAYFNKPFSIAVDSEDNFFVGPGEWEGDQVIRKLTIE